MDFKDVVDFADKVTTVLLLLLIIVGGARKLWVFGWTFQEKSQDCDEWKAMALRGANLAERALDTPPPSRRK